MGNLPLTTGLFTSGAPPVKPDDRFTSRPIRRGITYYQVRQSSSHSSATPDPLADTLQPSQVSPRPLLLFFSWLGAHPGAAAKYYDAYLARGMDVLLVQSSVMHFLWPGWGLNYGMEVLKVLEGPEFTGRPLLVHASSIGGYTFTQVLVNVVNSSEHSEVSHRVVGHIYDSLVAGTLEHMATGLGRTLAPLMERVIKNTAMLYFWLFKGSTADVYQRAVRVFASSPVTAPALFFSSRDDALCDPDALDAVVSGWRRRGVAVRSRTWEVSKHAAHMRCHPQEYRETLEAFLDSLPLSPPHPQGVDAL
ncbi:uncharacterized protein LOC130929286 [Corythoichthys intestinalis]|uniref:uncharacterized protein LOC130929286 n=1 Tax=Corythoichthys intestinalis TaxID=161448 RepID=UPI0025A66403|nr:uncharacterized protein LOC130929286 [Corythoichthys intestinalis]XP_061809473.1 uncharacterized protein LOC133600485 [Nerophis lumbriciformis]